MYTAYWVNLYTFLASADFFKSTFSTLSLFRNKFINSCKIPFTILHKNFFGMKRLRFCHYVRSIVMGNIS